MSRETGWSGQSRIKRSRSRQDSCYTEIHDINQSANTHMQFSHTHRTLMQAHRHTGTLTTQTDMLTRADTHTHIYTSKRTQ